MLRAPSTRCSSIEEAPSLSSRARCNKGWVLLFPSREPQERLAPRGANSFSFQGKVAELAPLIVPVPETDTLCYPMRNLVCPTPLLVMPLPITELVLGPKGNEVVDSFSIPAVVDVEFKRWDSRLIGCFR
ncbi:hypothetical protein RJT34_17616 [Clitoria ternatea]|uniref:Uncharacterized protein n=1 Tax=Clitoria ternatea TaxID=43366 RepID=A0AAN9PF07_CLITE